MGAATHCNQNDLKLLRAMPLCCRANRLISATSIKAAKYQAVAGPESMSLGTCGGPMKPTKYTSTSIE
ncbi:hypothetical protein D3C76_996420 [compost metagenome]